MATERKSLAERLAAMDKVSDEVNKKVGKNIAGRLSKNKELRESLVQRYIPSVCHDFNIATGGGYPRGRCTLIAGIYNIGKQHKLFKVLLTRSLQIW